MDFEAQTVMYAEEKAGHYAETVVGGRILQGRWNDVCEK
jgi:hypothetical protein